MHGRKRPVLFLLLALLSGFASIGLVTPVHAFSPLSLPCCSGQFGISANNGNQAIMSTGVCFQPASSGFIQEIDFYTGTSSASAGVTGTLSAQIYSTTGTIALTGTCASKSLLMASSTNTINANTLPGDAANTKLAFQFGSVLMNAGNNATYIAILHAVFTNVAGATVFWGLNSGSGTNTLANTDNFGTTPQGALSQVQNDNDEYQCTGTGACTAFSISTTNAGQCTSNCDSPGTPTYVNTVVGTNGGNQITIAVNQGDFVGVVMAPTAFTSSSQWQDSFGDTFTSAYADCVTGASQQTFPDCAAWFIAKSTGTDIILPACGSGCTWSGASWADHFINVGSVAETDYSIKCGQSPSSCTSGNGVNSFIHQGPVAVVWEATTNVAFTSGQTNSMTPTTGQTQITANGWGTNRATTTYWVSATANTNQFIINYFGNGVGLSNDHSLVYLIGVPAGPAITACYGNCGNPAVTLVNTNSTHSIAFNSSVTLIYEFQSAQNGYFKNVSISFAKAYVNVNVEIGLYAAPNCGGGQPPFTSAFGCQGVLVAGSPTFSPPKGIYTVSAQPGSVLVTPGEWLAVAVSSSVGGIDFNDTNAVVTPFQSAGFMPGIINNAFVATNLCGGCKMGLWAWLVGTGINTPTVPIKSSGPCFGLDCLLTLATNGLCQNLTVACQSGSALFLVFILTFITVGILLYMTSQLMPGVNITHGLMSFTSIAFIVWFAVFGSLSLINPWIIFLMFFAVAWLFVGKVRGSGPI